MLHNDLPKNLGRLLGSALGLLSAYLIDLGLWFLHALMISDLWNRLVATAFNAPVITSGFAFGITVLVSICLPTNTAMLVSILESVWKDASERAAHVFANTLTAVGFTIAMWATVRVLLAAGWIVVPS